MLFVVGCGGEEPDPTNSPPIADAGPDRTAFVGERVELVGSGVDPEGDPLRFEWSLLSKPDQSTASLDRPNALRSSFTVDVAGDYLLQLVARDETNASAPDSVRVLAEVSNSEPVARPGLDQVAIVGDTVTLDGTSSFDRQSQSLTYSVEA